MDLTRTPPPAALLAPQGATTIAARTCLLEGPAFDADGNLFFSDIFGNRIYRLTPGWCPLGLPGRQRADQRQHLRRLGAADQLRGRRAGAGRTPSRRADRHEDR